MALPWGHIQHPRCPVPNRQVQTCWCLLHPLSLSSVSPMLSAAVTADLGDKCIPLACLGGLCAAAPGEQAGCCQERGWGELCLHHTMEPPPTPGASPSLLDNGHLPHVQDLYHLMVPADSICFERGFRALVGYGAYLSWGSTAPFLKTLRESESPKCRCPRPAAWGSCDRTCCF